MYCNRATRNQTRLVFSNNGVQLLMIYLQKIKPVLIEMAAAVIFVYQTAEEEELVFVNMAFPCKRIIKPVMVSKIPVLFYKV